VPGKVYARGGGRGGGGGLLKTLGSGVFSVSNANDAYVAVVQLEALPKDGPLLAMRRGVLNAESWGSGFGASGAKGSASWRLDRAKADEVARLWRVTRRDRAPLGAGLVGRWKPKGPFVVGKPLEIVLTLENGGTAPVWFNTGGRSAAPATTDSCSARRWAAKRSRSSRLRISAGSDRSSHSSRGRAWSGARTCRDGSPSRSQGCTR
jgi:hypothetical protein